MSKLDDIFKLNHIMAKLPVDAEIEFNTEAAKQAVKDLMLELIDQTVPKSKPNAFNIPTILDKIRSDLTEKVNEL